MPTKTVNEITSNYIDFVEYFDCVYVDTNYILMVHDDIANGGTRELIEQIMEIVVMNDLCDYHFKEACELIHNLQEYLVVEK